jgi:hypothetical protein
MRKPWITVRLQDLKFRSFCRDDVTQIVCDHTILGFEDGPQASYSLLGCYSLQGLHGAGGVMEEEET